MFKNPFSNKYGEDKFRIKPHLPSKKSEEVVAFRLLKLYLTYVSLFFLWLIISENFIPMIFAPVSIMWALGYATARAIPQQSVQIARKTRFTIMIYISGLMSLRYVIFIILKTPIEMWRQTLMVDLEPAFINTFIGFISMAFVIGMAFGFVNYVRFLAETMMFHRANKKTEKVQAEIMRKAEGDEK